MNRCLPLPLALLALSVWPAPALARSGTGLAPLASPATWYECVEPGSAADVQAAFGLTLCTARVVRESRPEGIALPDSAVLITGVEADSAAADQKLLAGDAIYRVSGIPVTEAAEAARRLAARTAGETRVNFLRDGRPYLVRLWRD
jgi:C-terminal processing protease CtpA/Prc